MNEHKFTKLWAWRYSAAWGYRWVRERSCEPKNSIAWLKVFQDDEPNVKFVISESKPKPIV